MSLSYLHRMLLAAIVASSATLLGCAPTTPAQFTVVGMQHTGAATAKGEDTLLYVRVVNRAKRPMRLERLSYTFGADGAAGASGEVRLGRYVAAGSAVVVEVPVDLLARADAAGTKLTLKGRLFATLDKIQQSFPVQATVVTEPKY